MDRMFGAAPIDLDHVLRAVVDWADRQLGGEEISFSCAGMDPDLAALVTRVCTARFWHLAGSDERRRTVQIRLMDEHSPDTDSGAAASSGDPDAVLWVYFTFADKVPLGEADSLPGFADLFQQGPGAGVYVESDCGNAASLGLLSCSQSVTLSEQGLSAVEAVRSFCAYRHELVLRHNRRLKETLARSIALSGETLSEIATKNHESFLDRHSLKRIAGNIKRELYDYRMRNRARAPVKTRETYFAEQQKQIGGIYNGMTSARQSGELNVLKALASSMVRTRIGLLIAGGETFGGLEQWVCDIAKHLRSSGYLPYLLVHSDPVPACRVEVEFPGETVFLGTAPSRLAAAVEHYRLDGLIVNHSYEGLADVPRGVFVAEVLHNIYFWQRDDARVRRARERVDRYVAVSETASLYATEFLKMPPGQVEIIPHGLNSVGLYRPQLPYLQNRLVGKEFRVLSVGNLYPQKNTLALLRAFAEFRKHVSHARLRLAGALAEPVFGQLLMNEIQQLKLDGAIDLLGSLGRGELSREYSAASLFVLPSLYEGYGLVSLEACHFGLPLILSNTGYGQRLLSSGASGELVQIAVPFEELTSGAVTHASRNPPEADVTALCAAMLKVHENYQEYHRAGMRTIGEAPFMQAEQAGRMFVEMLRKHGVN